MHVWIKTIIKVV